MRLAYAAALSFIFNYLFFLEYLRPLRRVHIPYDLEFFHLPLADYAFRALRQGRFPLWDNAIYCGISFAGNVQAALFYPPLWLLFAVNRGRENLSYVALELFVVLHVWIAFVLAYGWLRARGISTLAAVLGAGLFAYSGQTLLQLQHLGVTAGLVWLPLGLWGIDDVARTGRWRPLWKVALASALCFLAGYAPAWCAFAICMAAYAAFSLRPARTLALSIAAVAFSLGLAAVQLLPAWYATQLMVRESRYTGIADSAAYYLSYVIPNFWRFGMHVDAMSNYGREYLYLGGVGLVGLALAIFACPLRRIVPLLGAGVVCFIIMSDLFGIPARLIRLSPLLAHAIRPMPFLAVMNVVAAGLAAHGLHEWLARSRSSRSSPAFAYVAAGLLLAWSAILFWRWFPGDAEFPYGWQSAIDSAAMIAIVTVALAAMRYARGRSAALLSAALLLAAAVEYKVHGTSKRFNANPGMGANDFIYRETAGMNGKLLSQMMDHREYRIVVDLTGPFPQLFRHKDLTSPQGFDPLFTQQYSKFLAGRSTARSNWEFDIDPDRVDVMRALGVRYFVTTDTAPLYPKVSQNPAYHRLTPFSGYHRVYELEAADPPFSMDTPAGIRMLAYTAETRSFDVHSERGGRFRLADQLFPGWRVTVDGHEVPLERADLAFMSAQVPPGDHRVEFRYFPTGLTGGAVVSAVCTLLLLAVALPLPFWRRTVLAPEDVIAGGGAPARRP